MATAIVKFCAQRKVKLSLPHFRRKLHLPEGQTSLVALQNAAQPFVRQWRKKVLDKRTLLLYNRHNLITETIEAEVKLQAHPQRVPHS